MPNESGGRLNRVYSTFVDWNIFAAEYRIGPLYCPKNDARYRTRSCRSDREGLTETANPVRYRDRDRSGYE